MAEEERLSETEKDVQDLISRFVVATDPEEQKELQKQIRALKQSPEGQKDKEKHLKMGRRSR